MKKTLLYWISACLCCLLSSCKGDSMSTGLDLVGQGSQGFVQAMNMPAFRSHLVTNDPVVSRPDSLLLGEMETPFGSIKADILTQLACPEGFEYPENAEADSLVFYLVYGSWVGDGNSPLEIDIWWLDRGVTLNNSVDYQTDIDVHRYCTMADSTKILDHHRIVVAANRIDSIILNGRYQSVVSFRVNKQFEDRFFSYKDFRDGQEAFNSHIPGFYITSAFGGSTVLNVTDIQLQMFYHFRYPLAGLRDTTIYAAKGFYGNSDVRQVNHVEYLENADDPDGLLHELEDQAALLGTNYIIGPSGVYTELTMPLRDFCHRIMDSMSVHGYGLDTLRPYINLALVDVDVLNVYQGDEPRPSGAWAQPARAMLLLKSHAVSSFFADYSSLSDTLAILSYLRSQSDESGDYYEYSYQYDLSPILIASLRDYQVDSLSVPDTLRMTLVPVDITSEGNGSITAINPAQTISTTIIRGAEHGEAPMNMEVVFSGF